MPALPQARAVIPLGLAQTLAWASSYYLPAMLAAPMARDLGLDTPSVFAAFSLALVVSAFMGPWSGRIIDRHGGRPMLMATNLIFAAGLVVLAAAQSAIAMVAGWILIGVAMGSGLYEAAFAALVRLYGHDSRRAITGITLMAGLASTVGWPLSLWLEARHGWRGACMAWAGLHLVLGLPLNAALPRTAVPRASPPSQPQPQPTGSGTDLPSATPMASTGTAHPSAAVGDRSRTDAGIAAPAQRLVAFGLATVFAITWFISTAMASHLPRAMEAAGTSLATAVAVGALVGPAQVLGRLLEFGLLRHVHPLLSARLAAAGHPLGVALLLAAGPGVAPLFALLHGTGNGILTIAKGTLPLVLFGTVGYGARQGWLMVPARFAQALSPYAFGLALDRWGANALWLTCGMGLAAMICLMVMPRTAHEP